MKKIAEEKFNSEIELASISDSCEMKLEWITPSISVNKINKLTAGFGPNLKDLPVHIFGAS
jgi:hypothetical protein